MGYLMPTRFLLLVIILVWFVLRHINLNGLFNADKIFIAGNIFFFKHVLLLIFFFQKFIAGNNVLLVILLIIILSFQKCIAGNIFFKKFIAGKIFLFKKMFCWYYYRNCGNNFFFKNLFLVIIFPQKYCWH